MYRQSSHSMFWEIYMAERLKDEMEHVRDDKTVYVTDIVSCPLKRVFSMKYRIVDLADSIINSYYVLGDIVHKGIQRVLKQVYGDRFMEEVDVEAKVGDITVKGRVDGILDGRIGFEIKYSRSDYELPREWNELQCKIYNTIANLDFTELVYLTNDRCVSYIVDGRVTMDELRSMVEETIAADKAPRYAWECRYCVWASMCWRKVSK